MSCSAEIVATPTSDSLGTTIVLRTPTRSYVFGSQAEGTQRALVQHGTKLLKSQHFFLTGRTEWHNVGGLVGMMLTLADAASTSWQSALEITERERAKGKTLEDPPRPHINIFGPPNLKFMLGTCRRFIFRKGIPILATEYKTQEPERGDDGAILPSWEDQNLKVWAMSVAPANLEKDAQAEAALEARRHAFDTNLNTFEDHKAPENESFEDREARYDRIRSATLKFMFDSNWSFDTLVEKHISEVQMPAAMFIRNPKTHSYEPYKGAQPGGSEPLPDIKVFTRTPWPGANILHVPPAHPAPESVSYIVRTLPQRGTFDVARAKALGVKPGPDFGKLTSGKSVLNQDGKTITPEQVLGAERPGQGIAILDVPSSDHLQQLVQREELNSPAIMSGIQAVIWSLGPGVPSDPLFKSVLEKMSGVKHIVSSAETSPNRITYDSVTAQTTRLSQIDSTRYHVPLHDNKTIPQQTLQMADITETPSLPDNVLHAERGLNCILMPSFSIQTDRISSRFIPEPVKIETEEEILELAAAAQKAIEADEAAIQSWGSSIPHPDTEIITLGTGSALPSKYRNVSATLIRVPGVGNYLLDCGENTLGQLTRLFSRDELTQVLRDLRMIWISHLHADHHLGTAGLIKAWYQVTHNSTPNPTPFDLSTLSADPSAFGLSVISHNGMLQWLHEYASIEDYGYSRILPLSISANDEFFPSALTVLNAFGNPRRGAPITVPKDMYPRILGLADIQAVRVNHCHGALAVSFTFPPSPATTSSSESSTTTESLPLKISYSGDCRPSQPFTRIGANSTLLIHEATFDDELAADARAKKHSTTSEALGVAAQMRARAVLLTHFSQRYQKIPVLESIPGNGLAEEEEEVGEEGDVSAVHTVGGTGQNAEAAMKAQDGEGEGEGEPMDADPPPAPAATPSTTQPLPNTAPVPVIPTTDLQIAVAFDYMRLRLSSFSSMRYYNTVLNRLLDTETPDDADATVIRKPGVIEGGGPDKPMGGRRVRINGKVENGDVGANGEGAFRGLRGAVNGNGKKVGEGEGGSKKRVKVGKGKRNN